MCHYRSDTGANEVYTLSLHDALPICTRVNRQPRVRDHAVKRACRYGQRTGQKHLGLLVAHTAGRSEEHTSELQSQSNLVCRLLLEKKKLARSFPSSTIRQSISNRART